jgi:hypothetical protein
MSDVVELAPPSGRRRRQNRRKDRILPKTRERLHADVEALALSNVDGRLRVMRRVKAISRAVANDRGGLACCSEVQKQMIARFSAVAVLAENIEAELVLGGIVDIERHAVLVSSLCRLANRIGIDRAPKEVASLGDYLSEKYRDTNGAPDAVEEGTP